MLFISSNVLDCGSFLDIAKTALSHAVYFETHTYPIFSTRLRERYIRGSSHIGLGYSPLTPILFALQTTPLSQIFTSSQCNMGWFSDDSDQAQAYDQVRHPTYALW
jgi:hypothetical protein